MTRRNKLIILITYLVVLAVSLPLYHLKRSAANRRLQTKLQAAKTEKAKNTTAASEMQRLRQLFPTEPGIAAFIESLHAAAKDSKLAVYDVRTETSPARADSRAASAQPVNSHRFTIALEGSFRSVAEYIRRIQNFERFKRINEIRLVPGKQGTAGTISLELFSLKEQQ